MACNTLWPALCAQGPHSVNQRPFHLSIPVLGQQLQGSYQGSWQDGQPHGQGHFQHTGTSAKGGKWHGEYDGDWQHGQMHGQGTLRQAWDSGLTEVITCQYINSLEHGAGTAESTAADGTHLGSYSGDYLGGMRSGHGQLTMANGDT